MNVSPLQGACQEHASRHGISAHWTIGPERSPPSPRWWWFESGYEVAGVCSEGFGDAWIAVGVAFSIRSGAKVVARDSSTLEVVTNGAFSPGEMWIEPGRENLPDHELNLFWRCVFVTRFDTAPLSPSDVYEVGIEDARITFSGDELLNGYGVIVYFDVDIESKRELIRIGR